MIHLNLFSRPLLKCFSIHQIHPGLSLLRVTRRFRNVSLNLRIVTVEAAVLGVEGHVCELQLGLREISELQVSTLAAPPYVFHPFFPFPASLILPTPLYLR